MRAVTSSSIAPATSSEYSREPPMPACMPRNGSELSPPYFTAPSRSVMPYCVTIARATFVAFSMSLDAPVVGSWNTSSSAARPPSM